MKFFQPVLLTFMLGISKSASAADYASNSGSPASTGSAIASSGASSAVNAVAPTNPTPAASSISSVGSSYDASASWNPMAGVPPLPPSMPATQYSNAGTVTVLQNGQGYNSGVATAAIPLSVQDSGYKGQSYGGGFDGGVVGAGESGGYGAGGSGAGFGGSGAGGSFGGDGYDNGASGGFQSAGGDYDNGGDIGEGLDDGGDDFGGGGIGADDGGNIGSGGAGTGDYGADVGARGGDYAAKPVLIAKVTGNVGGGSGYGGNVAGVGGSGYGDNLGGGSAGGYGGNGVGGAGGYDSPAALTVPISEPIAAPLPEPIPVKQIVGRLPVQAAGPVDIPIKSPVAVFKPMPVYQGISAHSGLAGPVAYPAPIRTAYRHSTPYVSGTLNKYPVGTGFQTGRIVPFARKAPVYHGPFRIGRPRVHAKPISVPSLDLSALLGGLASAGGLGGIGIDKLAPLMPLLEGIGKNLPIPSLQFGADNGAAVQALLAALSQIPLPSVSVNIPTNGPSPSAVLSQLLSAGEKFAPTIKLDSGALAGLGSLTQGLSVPGIKIDTTSPGMNLGSLASLAGSLPALSLPGLSLPSLSLGHSGHGLSLPSLGNFAGLSGGLSSGGHSGISFKPIPIPKASPLTGPSVSLIKSMPVLSKLKLPEVGSLLPPSLAQALSFHTITDMLGSLSFPRLGLSKKETPKVTVPVPISVPKRILNSYPMHAPIKGHVVMEDFPYGRSQFGLYDEPCNDRVKAIGKGY